MAKKNKRKKSKVKCELADVLEIQLAARIIENEMIMRYTSDPKNLAKIRALVDQFLKGTARLTHVGCPKGWDHKNSCICVPPFLQNHVGGGSSKGKK